MLNSPTIALAKRELLSTLRSWGAYAAMAALVLVTLLQLWSAAAATGPALAPALLASVMFVLYQASLIFIPPLAALSISTERQRGTWPLLQTSLLRPLDIVAAKFGAVMAVFLLLAIALMPALGAVFFFVGVSWPHFALSLCYVIAAAAMAAAIGICCSAAALTTARAIIYSYLFALPISNAVAPPKHLSSLILDGIDLLQLLRLPCMAVVAILSLKLAKHLVAQPAFALDRNESAFQAAVMQSWRNTPWSQSFHKAREAGPAISDAANPLIARERYALGGFNRGAFYGLLAFWMLPLLIFSADDGNVNEAAAAIAFGQGLLLWLFTPALVAHAASRDCELANSDALRMTLLSPAKIVAGKAYGAAFSLAAPAAAMALPALLLLLSAATDGAGMAALAAVYVMAACTVFLLLAISLFVSVGRKSLPSALLVSYGASFGVIFVLPSLLVRAVHYSSANHFADIPPGERVLAVLVWWPSPPYVYLNHVGAEAGFGGLMLNSAIALGFAALLMRLAAWRYARREMRDR